MRRGSVRPMLAIVAAFTVALVPHPALACAVCFVGTGKTITAFYATAMLLTALPLVLVGGIAFWLRRRLRARSEPGIAGSLDALR